MHPKKPLTFAWKRHILELGLIWLGWIGGTCRLWKDAEGQDPGFPIKIYYCDTICSVNYFTCQCFYYCGWLVCICCSFFILNPDVHVEPHKKQLHVTLAYHFQASSLPALEKLAKNVDVSAGCDWLAVLFSRDIRFANHEVHSHLVPSLNKHVSAPQL